MQIYSWTFFRGMFFLYENRKTIYVVISVDNKSLRSVTDP